MRHYETVNGFLHHLSHRSGIDGLVLSPHGTCGLAFREKIPLALEVPSASSTLHLYATMICPIPERNREALFERLLKINLLGLQTKGATFAINEQHNAIVLCYSHSVDLLDAWQFETLVENFLSVVDYWHGHSLLEGSTVAPDDRQSSDDDRPDMIRV